MKSLKIFATLLMLFAFTASLNAQVLTKDQIYEAAWESDKFPDDNSIMVAISKLRSKISDGENDYIHTIRGLGYRMEEK